MAIKEITEQSKRHVEAVVAACTIMECFLRSPNQTLKEIIEQTNLTRNRIMRIAGTLESRGYLLRNSKTGVYSLGPMLMSLGREYERQSSLADVAKPLLQDLARVTGESASIHTFDKMDRLILARVESSNYLRLSVQEGNRSPINLGASGKIFLAFGPDDMRYEILKSNGAIGAALDKSAVPDELSDELKKIKIQGYVYSQGLREPAIGIIAAPVFGKENCFLGALVIGGPIHHFASEALTEKIRWVMTFADKITWRLGGDKSFFSSKRHDHNPLNSRKRDVILF